MNPLPGSLDQAPGQSRGSGSPSGPYRPDPRHRLDSLGDPAEPSLSPGALLTAALLAVDPQGLGGIRLCGPASAMRTAWLNHLRALLPPATPWERLPIHATDAAVLGGLDLAATLHTGRAVAQQGLLARAHGGVLVLGMAERVPQGMAAHLAAVLDQGEVQLAREGLSERRPARLALVALDEGERDAGARNDGEQLPPALCDRLAFNLDLSLDFAPENPANSDKPPAETWTDKDITAARARLSGVSYRPQAVETLCATALVLGVDSLRGPLLALRVAQVAAALTGALEVDDSHTALAARLVLAPRATRLPPAAEADAEEGQTEPTEPSANEPKDESDEAQNDEAEDPEDLNGPDEQNVPTDEELQLAAQQALEEMVVQAAIAAIPPGLLAALKAGEAKAQAARGGRAGAAEKNQRRGRPIGARRGEPRAGARLHVLDTLRAAAPWQKLRRGLLPAAVNPASLNANNATPQGPRILVRRDDFHVMRFKQNRASTTVFLVDASGSSALHRLAEAKGAVELLLADCYVRRDRVAVLSFGGVTAQLLLPPTRSLARAKRSLSALPGGGGTPLATGMDAARELAIQIARQGETPVVVLLTDGRANIARDGKPGRAQAALDALQAAREFSVSKISALLIDTSPQPQAQAQNLAQAMGATYLPLPFAGAKGLNQAVRLASGLSASGSR